jgi:hypothetical protein
MGPIRLLDCSPWIFHKLHFSPAGFARVWRQGEFAGLSLDEQRQRIKTGMRILKENGLAPKAWVAPAHGFDSLTLEALRLESDIRIISDGFTSRAVRRKGFVWLPQQLWRPRRMKAGLWTICLHPNDMGESALEAIRKFISSPGRKFPDPHDVARNAVTYGPRDALFSAGFAAALYAKQMIARAGR